MAAIACASSAVFCTGGVTLMGYVATQRAAPSSAAKCSGHRRDEQPRVELERVALNMEGDGGVRRMRWVEQEVPLGRLDVGRHPEPQTRSRGCPGVADGLCGCLVVAPVRGACVPALKGFP
jgi:hypothetical protein